MIANDAQHRDTAERSAVDGSARSSGDTDAIDMTDLGRYPPAVATELPQPINWNVLDADQAEAAWFDLNAWVDWLRHTYGLPPSVVPPYWHRHPELVWELSALHLHWLSAHDPAQHASAPFGWHRDFADARQRLRDWVAQSGTRLDDDRPLRQTPWPGEANATNHPHRVPRNVRSRDDDFAAFVSDDVSRRRATRDLRDDA